MPLCLLDFANRFVQIYLTVGVQNFSWKKGVDANCTPSRVSEKGAFIDQSLYVRHEAFTWWQCQEDDYIYGCSSFFFLTLLLLDAIRFVRINLKIPARKGLLMQFAHLQESVRWVHSWINPCISAMRHLYPPWTMAVSGGIWTCSS